MCLCNCAGMTHLGGQYGGGTSGGLTPQQAAAVAAFPFPASAHMLGLANFAAGNLSNLGGVSNGLAANFGPRKIDIKVSLRLVIYVAGCDTGKGRKIKPKAK